MPLPGAVPSVLRPAVRRLLLPGSASGFSPLQLFANGEAGAWYDPSDLTTVWQDAAGTTAAGVDDPVGRIDDKSGNGNNATQSTDSKRPMLRQDGNGNYYLEPDGVDDFFVLPNAIVDVDEPQTMVTAFALDAAGNSPYLLGSNGADSGFLLLFREGTREPRFAVVPATGSNVVDNASAVTLGDIHIYRQTYDGSGTGVLFKDQTQSATDTQAVSTIKTPSTGYELFRNASDARCISGKLYGFLIISRALIAAELTLLEDYMATKAGVSL